MPSLLNSAVNPCSSAVTDAILKESHEKSLIQLSKDIPCNWHLYSNYIKNKIDYLTAKKKYNTSTFESCNQVREGGGYQIVQEGEFKMLKKTSQILKYEKPRTIVRKIANRCNKKQLLNERSKRSYPSDKETLVNFKKTSKKLKELESILKKPQVELEKKQQFVVSKFCPKHFDKRSFNNNNIKHKPRAGYSHKNCGILSEKLYYSVSKNVNKISDPTLYRSRNVKGKQPNKIKNEKNQKENHNFCLRILSNSLLSHQTDRFLDITCKKYSCSHILTPLQNYHGDITRRKKQIELLVRSVKEELSRRNSYNLEIKKNQASDTRIPHLTEMRPAALKLNPASNKRMETFNWYQKQNQQLLQELRDVQSTLKIVKELREKFKD